VRLYLGAFGDPGHAFPMLALGAALVARGHDVVLETWRKWQQDVEAAGMRFVPAPEYDIFPALGHYEAAARATPVTEAALREHAPDVVVADILTLAPALAAERLGLRAATLVPHLCPVQAPGAPPFSSGARPARTPLGRGVWRLTDRLVERGLRQGLAEYNDARARLGLPPRAEVHPGLSRSLTLVATLPALEYPRAWPAWLCVPGPLMWEPPGERIEPPRGRGPVVLVAPSTAHDAEQRLLRAALDGLAGEDVRVIATWNGREPGWVGSGSGYRVPPNAVLVPWLSYAKTMPACDVVVTHGGHGTLVRALESGCVPVISPAAGDMLENAARVAWAGLGVRLPRRLLTPTTLRLAVRRALTTPSYRDRVRALPRLDGAVTAADMLEAWSIREAN
jgi:UDP:flavonoid glycosyltransferase YjiC (YdhE family)